MRVSFSCLVLLSLGVPVLPALADPGHSHPAGDPELLGSVEFQTSCAAEVQERFARAAAMLHSFWYEEAAMQFRSVAEADPACAIAWWGVAMSQWQPLWEPRGPNADAMRNGQSAVRAARAAGGGTPFEIDLIAAVATFYDNADSIDHRDRVLAYEAAMQTLYRRYPENTEARLFYALSLLGSATSLPPDKSYQRQRNAGELLVPVFNSRPDHPGVAHYIIHAYDYPPLARGALEAARRYAAIAPDAPHAQHMPSHIFTRLGLWDDSIKSNRHVIRVARKYGVMSEELHAMDYLVFAYLQKGEDENALAVVRELPELPEGAVQTFAALHARAAIPARYSLERGQWKEAALLQEPDGFPGGRYAWANAAIHFAKAVGAARSGEPQQARIEVQKLAECRDTLKQLKEDYWATQVEVQRRGAAAWLALAAGRETEALELMQSAAELEDTADKHPVTPGQIIPARVLLGEMLLQMDEAEQALHEFETVLEAEPNRFGPLFGAARAAELSGQPGVARERFSQLVAVAPESRRREVRAAMDYLARSAADGPSGH